MSLQVIFRRLSFKSTSTISLIRTITTNSPSQFRSTQVLLGEPLKKKKRLDPAIVRAREERRKRKIEKQIRRLEKHARQLKPIEECEVPLGILDSLSTRRRELPALSVELLEKRALLEKKWSNFKREQHLKDVQMLDKVVFSQQKALDELQKESKELYQAALEFDPQLIPYKIEGPVETPPIEKYSVPDGEYEDISRKW